MRLVFWHGDPTLPHYGTDSIDSWRSLSDIIWASSVSRWGTATPHQERRSLQAAHHLDLLANSSCDGPNTKPTAPCGRSQIAPALDHRLEIVANYDRSNRKSPRHHRGQLATCEWQSPRQLLRWSASRRDVE